MKKEELFKKVAKYIAENHALLPLESDIDDVISSFMDIVLPVDRVEKLVAVILINATK